MVFREFAASEAIGLSRTSLVGNLENEVNSLLDFTHKLLGFKRRCWSKEHPTAALTKRTGEDEIAREEPCYEARASPVKTSEEPSGTDLKTGLEGSISGEEQLDLRLLAQRCGEAKLRGALQIETTCLRHNNRIIRLNERGGLTITPPSPSDR